VCELLNNTIRILTINRVEIRIIQDHPSEIFKVVKGIHFNKKMYIRELDGIRVSRIIQNLVTIIRKIYSRRSKWQRELTSSSKARKIAAIPGKQISEKVTVGIPNRSAKATRSLPSTLINKDV